MLFSFVFTLDFGLGFVLHMFDVFVCDTFMISSGDEQCDGRGEGYGVDGRSC